MQENELRGYMEMCILIAKKSSPEIRRPLVGALVLSRDGKVVSEGYKYMISGTTFIVHAERMALDEAGDSARGGTLITTLEPCVEVSRKRVFEPCAAMIPKRGVKTVVLGRYDDSESVNSGAEMHRLQKSGINVVRYYGLMREITYALMPNGSIRLYEGTRTPFP